MLTDLCLRQTNNEIRETDRAIQLVRRSIIEKEEGLKVAQTRLDERTRRRCVEICRDAAMLGLVVVVVVAVVVVVVAAAAAAAVVCRE